MSIFVLKADEIKEIRKKYGLSQRGFGRLLGWGDKTIYRYENGAKPDQVHNTLLMFLQKPENMRSYLVMNSQRLSEREKKMISDRLNELEKHEKGPMIPVPGVNADVFHVMLRDQEVASVTLTRNHTNIIYDLKVPSGVWQPFSGGRLDVPRFYRFLKSRCYDDGRDDLPEILSSVRMDANNPWQWIKITHGHMLSDCFWIKINDEHITWEEVWNGVGKK